MRVAVVITHFGGGAGRLALQGALALDRAEYEPVLVTRGGALSGQAQAAGLRGGDRAAWARAADRGAAGGGVRPGAHL